MTIFEYMLLTFPCAFSYKSWCFFFFSYMTIVYAIFTCAFFIKPFYSVVRVLIPFLSIDSYISILIIAATAFGWQRNDLFIGDELVVAMERLDRKRTWVQTSTGLCQNFFHLAFTSPHYLWRSLGPFSLPSL